MSRFCRFPGFQKERYDFEHTLLECRSVTLNNKLHRHLALLDLANRENRSKSANLARFGAKTLSFFRKQREQRYCIISARAIRKCSFYSHVRCSMSLATCSRFFRPCLSRIRPALNSPRLHGCKLFSSLQKRPNFVVSRLPARHASGGNFGGLLSENGLLVLGCGLLGGSLAYVSISLRLCCHCFVFQTVHSVFSFPTLSHFRRSQMIKSASM